MISRTGVVGDDATFEYDIARIIKGSFGKIHEFVSIHHKQRPNIMFGHFRDCIEHGGVGMNNYASELHKYR